MADAPAAARDVLLMDGSTVRLRQITPDDADRLRDFFARLSPRSRYLRFHSHVGSLSDDDIRRFTGVDDEHLVGIVAMLGEGDEERIIGVGHYFRMTADSAEVAFAVEDTHQGRGIATQILDALAFEARVHGIETFEADVLGENRSMMEVFRGVGLPATLGAQVRHSPRQLPDRADRAGRHPRRRARGDRRRRVADAILSSRSSVAVVGASREPGTFGYEIFHNILTCGFTGDAYPVNLQRRRSRRARGVPVGARHPGRRRSRDHRRAGGRSARRRRRRARKGVRGIVVISAGFRETDRRAVSSNGSCWKRCATTAFA